MTAIASNAHRHAAKVEFGSARGTYLTGLKSPTC